MTKASKTGSLTGRLVKFVILGALGGAAGFGVGMLFADRIPEAAFAAMGWSDLGALVLAAVLIAAGGLVTAATGHGRALAAMTNGEEPAAAPERRAMRLQGLVVIGSGLLLAAPPVMVMLGNPAPGVTFFALMTAVIIHSVLNYGLWRDGDEMIRRIVVEAGAACFWIAQLALFIWAAAERLGLAPTLGAWDALIVLMALYLICSSVVGVRRGVS